jgi:hypothetical protein
VLNMSGHLPTAKIHVYCRWDRLLTGRPLDKNLLITLQCAWLGRKLDREGIGVQNINTGHPHSGLEEALLSVPKF